MALALSKSTQRLDKLHALVRLTRPGNVLMFFIGVGLGAVLVAGSAAFMGANGMRLLIAAISAAAMGAAANALNDVFDVEIDRINRPDRPLASGLLPLSAGWSVWVVGSGLGIGLSLLLSTAHVAIAMAAVALSFLYDVWLKRVPLAGNIVVSMVIAVTLIVYGGWAVGDPFPAFIGAGFAFLTNLARELIKDIEDMTGDAEVGAKTWPLVMGVRPAAWTAVGVLALTVLLTPVPYVAFGYAELYLLLILPTTALLVRAAWMMLADAPQAQASRASRLLKGTMLLGIAALALGGA
ncbi:MAG: geranylgeranylglycerol-phosphate geranylgeranyltransferase [Rhodothermales bacterium]